MSQSDTTALTPGRILDALLDAAATGERVEFRIREAVRPPHFVFSVTRGRGDAAFTAGWAVTRKGLDQVQGQHASAIADDLIRRLRGRHV